MTDQKPSKPAKQGIAEDSVQFNFRLPVATRERLQALADNRKKSIGLLGADAIQWYVDYVAGFGPELEACRRILNDRPQQLVDILRAVVRLEEAYLWLDVVDAGPRKVAAPRSTTE